MNFAKRISRKLIEREACSNPIIRWLICWLVKRLSEEELLNLFMQKATVYFTPNNSGWKRNWAMYACREITKELLAHEAYNEVQNLLDNPNNAIKCAAAICLRTKKMWSEQAKAKLNELAEDESAGYPAVIAGFYL